MSKPPKLVVVIVVSALSLLAGCGDDDPPGFRDCLEWQNALLKPLAGGKLGQSFSGSLEGAQHVVTSPDDNYGPHGYYDEEANDGYAAVGVAGCALDDEGNLWRLQTRWSIRKDIETPYPVSLCDGTSWPCDGSSTPASEPPAVLFQGFSLVCGGSDCTKGEWETFDTLWDLNPWSGDGTVTAFSPIPPRRFAATVNVVPPIIAPHDDATRVELDVTLPDP